MTRNWEPGTQYNYDDVVEYQGQRYKIIQPHRSQSDWTPPVTPALWGRLQGDGHDNQHHGHQQQQHQSYQPQQAHQQQHQQQHQQHGHGHEKDDHEGGEKKEETIFGIDKDKFMIGAGILGGAALLGGGAAIYKHHKDNKEEREASAWASGNWREEAQARTSAYHQRNDRDAVSWVLVHGRDIPRNAVLVGTEQTWNLYICRAYHEGGIQLGKASEAFKKGGVLGYSDDEIHVEEFEVLVGNVNQLKWVQTSGRINPHGLGYTPVEGGRESDGTILYVAKAPYKGAVHPGKASEKIDGAAIPYGGGEKEIREYAILCYDRRH